MKYQIINYDGSRAVLEVKLAKDDADMSNAQTFALSIEGINTLEDLEIGLAEMYKATLNTKQRGTYSVEVENAVQALVNSARIVTVIVP